jgi:hypothetical protein
MSLAITVTYPMPGAVLSALFPVCGTYEARLAKSDGPDEETVDRNLQLRPTPVIRVTVTKGSSSYGPYSAGVCTGMPGKWESMATVPAGDDYTVTATITLGLDSASHSIETVDVSSNPLLLFPHICCPIREEDIKMAKEAVPFKPGDKKAPRTLYGEHKVDDADEMFGTPYKLITSTTVTHSGGGTHYHVVYRMGPPARPGVYGTVDKDNKKWKLRDVEVDYHEYVRLFLWRKNGQILQTASHLF